MVAVWGPLPFLLGAGGLGKASHGAAGHRGPCVVVGRRRVGGLLDPGLWADPTLGSLANRLAEANNFFNLAFFVLAVVFLIAGSKVLPPSLTLYGLLLVIPAALFGTPASPLMGAPRYVLVVFPMFIVLGLISRNRLLFSGWLILSALVSLLLCALFVSWRFVA